MANLNQNERTYSIATTSRHFIQNIQNDFNIISKLLLELNNPNLPCIEILLNSKGGHYDTTLMMSNMLDLSRKDIVVRCIRAENMAVQLLLAGKERIGYKTSTIKLRALKYKKNEFNTKRITPATLKIIEEELMWRNEQYIGFISDKTEYSYDYLYETLINKDEQIILHGEEAMELEFFTILL